MYRYIVCAVFCAVIWVLNGRWISQAARERVSSEIYIHTGFGIFFTLLTLEVVLGVFNLWARLGISWPTTIGFILYVPSILLVAASHHALKYKGKPETADPTATTVLVNTGVYGLIRQPMTLGMAIWSVALILVFQSVLSIVLGISAVFCFWISARKEMELNIRKFGDKYREYAEVVPMWNIFRGWRR